MRQLALHIATGGLAAYVILVYAFLPLGAAVHPDMKQSFLAHPHAIYTHAFASIVALVAGPLQFSANLRRSRPALHRWTGRAYLGIGVLLGGMTGLYLSRHAFGGAVAQGGFGVLAALWLYTGVRAFLAIRGGAAHAHREWMVLNFSLTLAALTIRVYLPASFVIGVDFAIAYPATAWLCWVPNLAVALWLTRRRQRRR